MPIRIERVTGVEQWSDAERLIRAYIQSLPFAIDFQDVDREIAELATEYGAPTGCALLAVDGTDDVDNVDVAVGVVGVRRFSDVDAELKRMYIDPSARGSGAGRALASEAVSAARDLGYRRLLLDTVAWMTTAIAIYEELGFVPVDAYRFNPLPDARFFALDL